MKPGSVVSLNNRELQGCPCRCRAMLGLERPFAAADPTATGLHDVPDPDEEWVA